MLTPLLSQRGKTPLHYARNEKTTAVFAAHAAKGGHAEQTRE